MQVHGEADPATRRIDREYPEMMQRIHDTAWRYWLVTDVLLLGVILDCAWSTAAIVALTAAHCVHFLVGAGSGRAFPVQVRFAWAALLGAGMWAPLEFIHWIQLAGTTAVVTVGYCPLARCLALAPWNRSRPLDRALVLRTLFGPPTASALIDR